MRERNNYPIKLFARIFFIFLLASFFACNSPVPDTEKSPNIILILADDLGYETLRCNGSTDYQTPELDRLAREGMRFTHAYAQPLCTPTRVQIMTGKYNFRNYIGFGLLDPAETTFGHLFQQAGYATCVVGKWQLYGNTRQRKMFGRTGTLPDQAGFDESCLWQVRDKYGNRFKDPFIEINGDSAREFKGGYGPDISLDFARDFISRKKDSSFLLYFPMALTHDPFQPTPDHPDYESFDSSKRLNDTTYFRANVAYMDKIVGALAQHVAEEGLAENTLILFIGDNGTDRDVISSFGNQRIQGNKGYTTDAGTHVPMIAYWPGMIKGGQVNDHLVDLTDFIPTMMEATGISLPTGFVADGVSFYPQLVNKEGPVREWVFCHYAPQWGNFTDSRFVHNGEWKLYESGEMFHIAEDPEEKKPVSADNLDEGTQRLMADFKDVLNRMK